MSFGKWSHLPNEREDIGKGFMLRHKENLLLGSDDFRRLDSWKEETFLSIGLGVRRETKPRYNVAEMMEG